MFSTAINFSYHSEAQRYARQLFVGKCCRLEVLGLFYSCTPKKFCSDLAPPTYNNQTFIKELKCFKMYIKSSMLTQKDDTA